MWVPLRAPQQNIQFHWDYLTFISYMNYLWIIFLCSKRVSHHVFHGSVKVISPQHGRDWEPILDTSLPISKSSPNSVCANFKRSESCSVVSNSLQSHGLYRPWNSPGQNTGVDSLPLLQGIFPTQGLNPGLPHRRQIPYQLSYQGSIHLCIDLS